LPLNAYGDPDTPLELKLTFDKGLYKAGLATNGSSVEAFFSYRLRLTFGYIRDKRPHEVRNRRVVVL
jgi:hypothetical protein